MSYYQQTAEEVIAAWKSSQEGLSPQTVGHRLEQYGENKLKTEKKINPVKIFFKQFKSFIIYLLFIAVVLSLLIGQYVNASLIFIILILNALIGFFQEYNTQKSLQALKKLNYVKARVYRNQKTRKINSKELVPGDIIYLEGGDVVPADARLISTKHLEVEESSLTGESEPVKKQVEPIEKEVDIGDQKNMVFSSTTVAKGSAWAIVVATGMDTEVGKIAKMVKDVEEDQTPLQKRLESFGRKLSYVILVICVAIFGLLLYTNDFTFENINKFALIALSLAVAAVPTVLPSVVTITLSVGVKRLLKKNALVRNLASVETLGSCDVICTDKTGTLTKNEMTVRRAWTPDGTEASLEGLGYEPKGKISTPVNPLLFKIGYWCNNASLFQKGKQWKIAGEPTEGALVVSARKAKATDKVSVLDEIPFDSSRKMMSVLVKEDKHQRMYTKGAPDVLIHHSSHILINGEVKKMTKSHREGITEKNSQFSSEGLRVLAFAYKEIKQQQDFKEEKLVFVGLQAMEDPPRADVYQSVEKAHAAGIRVVMITGDFKETAQAIAHDIGINGKVLEGKDLREMSDKQLHQALKHNTNIFARVIPEDKQRLVSMLQKEQHVVAMTGDGVNDAPALKKANIGVAVGTGTDVAKEASDFVLLDDSFTNIVNAVEEGRGIYDNIQKSIMLLLSGNFSEILVIVFAIMLGWNLPLTAVLLLWINLIANGAPAIAFSVDPYDRTIMQRKPLGLHVGILPKDKLTTITYVGLSGSLLSLLLFTLFEGGTVASDSKAHLLAQTMVFNFIVLYELFHVFMIRDEYNVAMFSNIWLWGALGSSLLLQGLLLYTPVHELFKLIPLTLTQLGILVAGLFVFMVLHLIYNRISGWYFKNYSPTG